VESLFTASLHLSDFVQTQNEAKILTIVLVSLKPLPLCADLKSILWVGPRVKDSIEDPFK
jgi:hypothetical protein